MPKSRKDPNKPKGVKSAYIFFVEKERANNNENGGELSFADLSKLCGAKWADMGDEDKASFVKLSEKDRKRHQKEMENYVPPEKSDSDSDEETTTRKKKKKTKDPNAPKRPTTAYFFFAADRRPEVKEQNPSYSITQVASALGEIWRSFDDEDKVPYEAKAAKDKQRYLTEIAKYNSK